MRIMKSLTCCLLAAALVLGLSCCGKKEEISSIASEASSLALVSPSDASQESIADDPSEAEEIQETEPVQGIAFPYALDDGKLLVTSLFQSSIMNPDCDLAEGEDIATLEIVNQSEEYLSLGSFEVTLPDGQVLRFTAAEIPPGAKVWAFELDNGSIETEAPCIALTVTSQYETRQMPEGIAVEVDGTDVTVTNQTGQPVTNLTVYYHDRFDDVYFGGLVYTILIDEIPAGGAKTIDANDCFLGDAEVVRVSPGDNS